MTFLSALVIFFYTLSIAVSCMSLGLAIAQKMMRKVKWLWVYIVFQSVMVGALLIEQMIVLAPLFMSGKVFEVFSFIFDTMLIASMGLVCVLLPYFMFWVIARPWRKMHRIIFYTLGIVYFGAGLTCLILGEKFLNSIIQTIIFLGIYVYCLVDLWSNLKNIKEKSVRGTCRTINIVSLTLIPFSIVAFFVPHVDKISYAVYLLAFSIIMMVYHFNYIKVEVNKKSGSQEITLESLSRFHITEREFSVVKLVCLGYTNKEIADELCISVNTVNNHVANIFSKTEVRSRIDLIKLLQVGPWS